VRFHDGTPLTPAAAAAALERLGATAQGDTLVIPSGQSGPLLLQTLADLPISKRRADGVLVGTGPFRVVIDAATRAVYEANDYWAGRPYLDKIEIDMGRSLRDQALDFDLNKADIVELGFSDTRRVTQNGKRLWTSPPVELIALAFEPSFSRDERVREGLAISIARYTDERAREAIALSIDRAAIHSVLLQRQGVPTGAILPQWLSGYAFLFPSARDLDKARQLASGAAPVTIRYDPADATARLIAERISVNAREAGITVRPTAGGQADARIVRLSVSSPDSHQALTDVATALGIQEVGGTPYERERTLLQNHLIVPLFHLPEIHGLGPRVRGWAPSRWGGWKLDSVWLAP
jgi:ABC-type transport system substrate-binding protein